MALMCGANGGSSLLNGVTVLTRTMKKITKIAGAAESELRGRSRSVCLRLRARRAPKPGRVKRS
jgi:hypothetical protein